jgi:hypothetical protein
MTSALLTTRDTGTDEKEPLGFELLNAADGIWIVRIASVNDDITLFEVRGELTDEVINSRACFDEKDDLARTLELGNKLFDRVSPLYVSAWIGVSKHRYREPIE